MNTNERIKAFVELGKTLININNIQEEMYSEAMKTALWKMKSLIQNEYIHHSWFIPPFIEEALKGINYMLFEEKLNKWLSAYPAIQSKTQSNRIGVVMAGNIPMVGFHDFLCVLLTGDIFVGKLSSNDKHLLPALAEILCVIEPRFSSFIFFTENKLENIDKIIATGSNNSARYFEYYFSKYPSIIRKHCNSVAILNGNETEEELTDLCDDICLYFGLGCRSVSKLYVPQNYNFTALFEHLNRYKSIFEMHHSYMNNLEYQKTVHLLNKIPFLDQGILLFKEHSSLSSPISVIHYEFYKEESDVLQILEEQSDIIQCVACCTNKRTEGIRFGRTQFPEVNDYANKIDTLAFLLETSSKNVND